MPDLRAIQKQALALLAILGALSAPQPVLAAPEKCTTCHAAEKYAGPVTDRHPMLPCSSCHAGYIEICNKGKVEEPPAGTLAADLKEKAPKSPGAAAECKSCHDKIFTEWAESDHGQGFLVRHNHEAPYCSDCHGKPHELNKKRVSIEREQEHLVQSCVDCHENPKLALRNQLKGHVVSTYRDSLHAKAFTLGDSSSAACHDCHDSHDIRGAEDPKSAVSAERVQETCARCHAGATASFASSFAHHDYVPQDYALGYWITRFFAFVTFGTVALLLVHGALDLLFLLRHRKKHA